MLELGNVEVGRLPDCRFNEDGVPLRQQLYTSHNVASIVEQLGIRARLNMMNMQLEMYCGGSDLSEKCQESLLLAVCDNLVRCGIGRNEKETRSILYTIARHDPYHPMEDWILTEKWDGVDRFADLLKTVPTETVLLPVYLRKWMIQVIQAARGWPDAPESLCNVLIFVGEQGVGKGRWLRSLLPPQFLITDASLHLSGSDAKDHQLVALSRPVAELAEIDSTFGKSHTGSLKSFLSRQVDNLRAPYARKAEERRRGTVFFGSVNHYDFLVDETGSRRFWPVTTAETLDWNHGLDLQQLWAQANVWWEDGEEWMLGPEHDEQRRQDANKYQFMGTEVEAIDAFLGVRENNKKVPTTVLELCQAAGLPRPNVPALASIRGYLNGKFGPRKKIQGKRNAWLIPMGSPPLSAVSPSGGPD